MSDALRHYAKEFRARRDVSPYDAEYLFDALTAEKDIELLTDILSAWAVKGPTEDEIYRFASILRERMVRVDTGGKTCVDIVGTGGSPAKLFNVSTAASLVVAGLDVAVAKHGNRAASSLTGSSDVLSHLGVDFDVDAKRSEENLAEHGLAFMFAPRHHNLSPELAVARKLVGRPTIFNCVGPLANPAGAQHQLIGVWDRSLVRKMARALFRLGTTRSWIVNGDDGLDEIAPAGPTYVAEVSAEGIKEFSVSPEGFGLEEFPSETLRVKDAAESSKMISNILKGEARNEISEQLVLLNAGAAISLLDNGGGLARNVARASESIANGHAYNKLRALSITK